MSKRKHGAEASETTATIWVENAPWHVQLVTDASSVSYRLTLSDLRGVWVAEANESEFLQQCGDYVPVMDTASTDG